MNTEEKDELWALIKQKEEETKKLRKEFFELTRKSEENELQEKYLGKYFLHKEYNDKWQTYIYVNKIDANLRVLCILFTLDYNEDLSTIINVTCETDYDFSCHYISQFSDNPSINECIKITKEEFLKANEQFLLHYNKFIK